MCPHERTIMSILRRLLSRNRPNRSWGIALFFLMISLALVCLRAPAQAAQANAPLKLKRGRVTIFRDLPRGGPPRSALVRSAPTR
jgi:hypothetical protein